MPAHSITPRTLGAIPTALRSSGTEATGHCAAAYSISRLSPTMRTWTPGSSSFNGSAKSSTAMNYGDYLGKSQLTDFSAGVAWAASKTQFSWRKRPDSQPTSRQSVVTPAEAGSASFWSSKSLPISASLRVPALRTATSSLTNSPDIDRTAAAGLSLKGKRWGRPNDTFGLAGIVNGISGVHQAFLNAGGLGILVGDGRLPNPGSERIIEMYYSLPLFSWRLTLDYQFIANPAYNRDRGPVSVIGTRLRAQF